MPWLSKYYQIFGTAGQRTAFSMRTNTANFDTENMSHISLNTWQNKNPARMTENWSILPHRPEVFFSMLPQVFLLFHEAAKQQRLSPDNSRFSGWHRRHGEQSRLGRRTLSIFHPVSWHLEFHRDVIPSLAVNLLCEQVLCQYICRLGKLRKGSSLRGVHAVWWLWEIPASYELSMDFHTCFYADSISCVTPWLTDFATVPVCERWGTRTGGRQVSESTTLPAKYHL